MKESSTKPRNSKTVFKALVRYSESHRGYSMIRQCGPEEDRWEAPMELKQREMMKRNDESEKK